MYRRLLVFSCKLLIKLLRLVGKNGSALPGLIIERLDSDFLNASLKRVEKRIILVTGTNGKTTTTKMLVTALRGAGARVVTNTTGSNMTRGLIAALIEDMTYSGNLKPTDWFVFEMDEAYAPVFTKNIAPKGLVALNVLRDQLDRYGEIDKTAGLIEQAAQKTDVIIYNQLDPLLKSMVRRLKSRKKRLIAFGVGENLSSHIANEQSLHGEKVVTDKKDADVVLVFANESSDMQRLLISVAQQEHELHVPVKGFHNALNATAVVAMLSELILDDILRGLQALSSMPTPFGRGEKLHFKGKNVTVALVKNPSGFMSNLETFVKQAKPEVVLFVVNDRFADGRDVSWLWDVDFQPFIIDGTTLFTSGIRGYDIALRLKQDHFDVNTTTNVARAVQNIMKSDYTDIVIIPTYTALFEVREQLAKYGKVPRIW
ncbi:MAG: MurT ligase domain-containing protein [Candidatus Saccharimonadales bacterium]